MEVGTFLTSPSKAGIQKSVTRMDPAPQGLGGSLSGPEHASSETKCIICSQNFSSQSPQGPQPGPSALGLAEEPDQRQLLGHGPCWP